MHTRRLTSLALLLLAAACSQQDKKPRLDTSFIAGTWESDTLPAADGPGRLYRLRIDPGGMAEFTSAHVGRDSLVERGTWDGADTLLRVVVSAAGSTRPSSLLLAIRRDRLGLVQFDSTRWGTGLTLYRR